MVDLAGKIIVTIIDGFMPLVLTATTTAKMVHALHNHIQKGSGTDKKTAERQPQTRPSGTNSPITEQLELNCFWHQFAQKERLASRAASH